MSGSKWLSLSLFLMYTCAVMLSIATGEEVIITLTSSITGDPKGGNANMTSVCSYGATSSVVDGFQWVYDGYDFAGYQGNGTDCVDGDGDPIPDVYTCDIPNRSFSIYLPSMSENDLSKTLCCAVSINQTIQTNKKCSTVEESINSATTQPTSQATTESDAVQIKSTALVWLAALLVTCALLTKWTPTSDCI